jgi:hypothetical protein
LSGFPPGAGFKVFWMPVEDPVLAGIKSGMTVRGLFTEPSTLNPEPITLGNINLLSGNGNYDNFKPSQRCRNLISKEKPMMDETSKALWNKGIEMMAQGYT